MYTDGTGGESTAEPASRRTRRNPELLLRHINLASRREALETGARDIGAWLAPQDPFVFVNVATTRTMRWGACIAAILAARVSPSGDPWLRLETVKPAELIQPQATAVHGITNANVATSPECAAVAPRLKSMLDGCDIAGLPVNGVDLALLEAAFRPAGFELPLTRRRVEFRSILLDHERDILEAAVRFDCGRTVPPARLGDGARRPRCCYGRLARCPDSRRIGSLR